MFIFPLDLAIVADPEPGTIYDGKVVRIVDFGAFVNFMPGTDGLVHISCSNLCMSNTIDLKGNGVYDLNKSKLLPVLQTVATICLSSSAPDND